MQWIDTTNLKNWASRRDCQEHLPLVIRRLIRATVIDISHINFPAGDSVVYPGLDGILNVTESTEYLPEGFSVWEIGTNQEIKRKAEEDYQKRKENTLGADPAERTFIFVTPRIWSDKDKWCVVKEKEGFWKDVRVYDAKILEEWLEQAPAVGAWLARHLEIYPEGAISLEDFWREWSSITNPPLTSELIIAGRNGQVELIRKWLSSSPSPIAVQAATSDEALAFLAGVINTLPEPEREFYLSKSLVVENSESFRHISVTGRTGLFLIPRFEEIEGTPQATQKGQHVYIPLGPDNKVITEKIQLPRLEREAFISSLKEMGLSEPDAQKYSRETGRSLTVLRRELTNIANQPEWAKADSAKDIIPALLAGRWTETKEADKEIISQLAGKSYESFSGTLSTWLHKPDSPILKIGEWWRLVSPIDTWFALAPFLTGADLQHLRNVVLKVLGSKEPALDLEPEKRWMSSVYGKEPHYSGTLREGVVQTLVLIAVFGDDARIPVSTTAQTWVDNVVRELLYDADWKLWHSLSDVLPLIAEASPSAFLDAVESSLSQDEPPIMGLFSETEDSLTSSSAHPGLLWALEGLAWNPQLLGRVTLILGELAKLDPGGRIANIPANTLRTIFLLWRPHTYASLEKRLEAIDTLIEREPEAGWGLLIVLMPCGHDICTPTHKTRWRQFSEKKENTITIAEHWESIKAITNRLLSYVGNDELRWAKMLENISDLPPEQRHRIIEQLSSCVNEISSGRSEVRNKLRKILSRHRSFPDANWALPEQELIEIGKVYSLLEPHDIIERFCWLFDEHWPDIPEGKERGDYKKTQKLIVQRRLEAVKTIKEAHGLKGLIKLAEQTNNSWSIGTAVAEVGLSTEEEHELLSLLEEEDEKKTRFVQSYILQRSLNEGDDWINDIVNRVRSQQWSQAKTINLFVAFPQRRVTWDLLESFNREIPDGYWKQCEVRLFDLHAEDKIYAITQLLHVKRYFTALDTAALFAEEVPAKLIAELLRKAATEESAEDSQRFTTYDIEKLFEVLDKSDEIKEEEIAKLEWLYLPLLARVGSGRPPKMLHRELSNNPEFFAEVIKCIYRPRNENKEEEEKKEEEKSLPQKLIEQRARRTWGLLHSWKTAPGSDSNGQMTYEKLKSWIDKARELCEKLDRKEGGDSHIGQVLAHTKTEDKDVLPPEPVCKIIDEIKSDDLDNGFSVGIYNKRGAVTKSPFEGGKQERVLAEQFRRYADKWSIRYPRTAAILTKIAGGYENEAKREDKEAERRDLEY